jgi:hypothetical protein
MARVAAVVAWNHSSTDTLRALGKCPVISDVALLVGERMSPPAGSHTILEAPSPMSPTAIAAALQWYQATGAAYLLWGLSSTPDLSPSGLNRLLDCHRSTRAAFVYSDYYERTDDDVIRLHPLIDYQPGSLRDDFDFGQLLLLNGASIRPVFDEMLRDRHATAFGGWYDLRLRLSEIGPIVHLPEPTYTVPRVEPAAGAEAHFSYVDPRNRDYQLEMERIATAHLKRIGAYIDPPDLPLATEPGKFSVEASVVIPVKNRCRTVADAIHSALSQETNFTFNVIVVDNYSDDGTTEILSEIAQRDARLIHLRPQRKDLGIGGCWNEALHSTVCGRFAVQLDSDDLYAGSQVLQRIVDEFHRTGCAMLIGSYTLVDFQLHPIPPGLVDHREWTDHNGQNNALRIAGLGAPRAFHVPTLREIEFPNVSYGEDYAVALKVTGRHRIGRIYDSLYWCRRWEDNTDHALPLETINRHAIYKDRLRSIEIAARQNRNT